MRPKKAPRDRRTFRFSVAFLPHQRAEIDDAVRLTESATRAHYIQKVVSKDLARLRESKGAGAG